MANMDKLRGKLAERKMTFADGAQVVGVSELTFSAKINEKTKSGFSVVEASKLSDVLELTNEEKLKIFF